MFQFALLFLEIILLAATAYIYWLTRKLAAKSTPVHSQTEGLAEQVSVAEMAQDVAKLMAEMQSVAGNARDDLIQHSTNLQETLSQAESTITELRTLLNQADALPPEPNKETNGKSAAAPATANGDFSKPVTEALIDFGKDLLAGGRSESTVKRTVGHVRGFAIWLGGKRYDQISVRRIENTDVDAYLDYLRNQKYHANTIRRKLIAIRTFTNWIDTRLNPNAVAGENAPGETGPPSGPNKKPTVAQIPAPVQADGFKHKSSYQAVFALADQGLAHQDIAAQTGLEQEAVRMLLTVRPPPSN